MLNLLNLQGFFAYLVIVIHELKIEPLARNIFYAWWMFSHQVSKVYLQKNNP